MALPHPRARRARHDACPCDHVRPQVSQVAGVVEEGALQVLKRAGKGKPPIPGDEVRRRRVPVAAECSSRSATLGTRAHVRVVEASGIGESGHLFCPSCRRATPTPMVNRTRISRDSADSSEQRRHRAPSACLHMRRCGPFDFAAGTTRRGPPNWLTRRAPGPPCAGLHSEPRQLRFEFDQGCAVSRTCSDESACVRTRAPSLSSCTFSTPSLREK